MSSNLRWKLITVAVVFIVFAAVGVYPIVAARYAIHSPAFLTDKQLKRMRRGKEILNRFDRDHNSRPLGL